MTMLNVTLSEIASLRQSTKKETLKYFKSLVVKRVIDLGMGKFNIIQFLTMMRGITLIEDSKEILFTENAAFEWFGYDDIRTKQELLLFFKND